MSGKLGFLIGIIAFTNLSFLCSAQGACEVSRGRNIIKFYEYKGSQAPLAMASFSEFRKAVSEELNHERKKTGQNIVTEPNSDQDTDYAKGQLDPTVSFQLMESDPRLLEVLDGRIHYSSPDMIFLIHSDIYIFPIRGVSTIDPISEDYPVTPIAFDDTRNVHLAATYYALALDARRRSCRTEANDLLSDAAGILKDIAPATPGSLVLSGLVQDEIRIMGSSP
jgi:hypothetical protein